jgi:hypothetical protein
MEKRKRLGSEERRRKEKETGLTVNGPGPTIDLEWEVC